MTSSCGTAGTTTRPRAGFHKSGTDVENLAMAQQGAARAIEQLETAFPADSMMGHGLFSPKRKG